MIKNIRIGRIKKYKRCVTSWLFVCFYVLFMFTRSSDIYLKLVGLLTITISILTAYEVKKNFNLFAIYAVIAYCNYSIIIVNYIDISFESFFISFRGEPVSNLGLYVLFTFSLILYIFLPLNIHETLSKTPLFIKQKPSKEPLITGVISIILLYILVYAFTRPSVAGLRGSPSPVYEYSIILFIVGFYFVGANKMCKFILTILLALFSLQNFIFGGRILGLQMVIAYAILFYSNRLTVRKVTPYAIMGLVLMSVIGIERGEFSLSMNGIAIAWKHITSRMFSLDTAYAAYYASLTFLKVEKLLSLQERLVLFMKFIYSILAGGRIPDSNLSVFTRQYFFHYGGGVFPYYFHVFMGWSGVLLGGFIVRFYSHIINRVCQSDDGFIKCLSVYIIATTFRWYLYTPLIIFRGVLFLVAVYFGINAINQLGLGDFK